MEHGMDSFSITRRYLDSLAIEGRILGACYPTCKKEVLGYEFETPIMTGALSHLKTGMTGFVKGAMQAGALSSVGMGDNGELGEILETHAKVIKIIKPYAEKQEILSRIRFAEEHGAIAVGMDVEHAVEKGQDSTVAQIRMKLPTLEELEEYIRSTRLPFFIKGALSVQDALTAQRLGAKGVILSHHNNLMKCAVPHAFLLPSLREAVGNEFLLIADGGIEDGCDAFKVLALGADLVCVGRPLMKPYEEDGPKGVTNLINRFTDQLRDLLVRTGSPDPSHIDPTVIHKIF